MMLEMYCFLCLSLLLWATLTVTGESADTCSRDTRLPHYSYPPGDLRNCRRGDNNIYHMEVLPGVGFDNLRNLDVGLVHDYTYVTCPMSPREQVSHPGQCVSCAAVTQQIQLFLGVLWTLGQLYRSHIVVNQHSYLVFNNQWEVFQGLQEHEIPSVQFAIESNSSAYSTFAVHTQTQGWSSTSPRFQGSLVQDWNKPTKQWHWVIGGTSSCHWFEHYTRFRGDGSVDSSSDNSHPTLLL